MIRLLRLLFSVIILLSINLYAAERPANIIEGTVGTSSGDYGRTICRLSADNIFKSDNLVISDNISYSDYRNSDSAILKQFNQINLMLGVKYGPDSLTGFATSSHEDTADSYKNIRYVAGYNHEYRISSYTELSLGLWCTNEVHIWNRNIPFIFPFFTISSQYENFTFKFGIVSLIAWRNGNVSVMFMYIPVWRSNFSVKYNITRFLFAEVFLSSSSNSVNSRKFEDDDRFNLLFVNCGTRLGFYLGKNLSISLGGGYTFYSREWMGGSTDIENGRNIGRAYFGEVRVSAFF